MAGIDKIKKIHDAEIKSSAIRKKALEASRAAIRDCEQDMAKYREDTLRAARIDARKSIDYAQESSKIKADAVRENEAKKNASIKAEIQENMKEAIEYIVDSIKEEIS